MLNFSCCGRIIGCGAGAGAGAGAGVDGEGVSVDGEGMAEDGVLPGSTGSAANAQWLISTVDGW